MGRIHINIHLNSDAAWNQLLQRLGAVTQHVALGMTAVDQLDNGPLKLPDAFFQAEFGSETTSSRESRQAFRTWLLGLGLRTAFEALEPVAVELFYSAHLASLAKQGQLIAEASCTIPEFFDGLKQKAIKEFTKRNWPTRIALLRDQHAILLPSEQKLLSINRARNCLTHRGGIVGPDDVKDSSSGALAVEYFTATLSLQKHEGQEATIEGETLVEKGEKLTIRAVDATKGFSLGDRVDFSAQEFVHLTMTIAECGRQLVEQVAKCWARYGVRTQDSSDARSAED